MRANRKTVQKLLSQANEIEVMFITGVSAKTLNEFIPKLPLDYIYKLCKYEKATPDFIAYLGVVCKEYIKAHKLLEDYYKVLAKESTNQAEIVKKYILT